MALGLRNDAEGRKAEMAPLAPETTARLWFDYVTGNVTPVEHTFQVRYTGADRTAAAAQTRVANMLTGMGVGSFRLGWRVIRVRTALAGEVFTLPQTPNSAVASFVGTNNNSWSNLNEADEWTIQARSLTGPRRCDLSLYGLLVAVPASFRVAAGSGGAAWAVAALSALNAASSPLVAIDGTAVQWYPYVNYNRNSYWERRLRIS